MALQQFTAGQTLTASQMTTLQANDFNFTRKLITVSSYTLELSDRGQIIEAQNAGGTVITIPLASSVAYEVGDSIEVLNGSTSTIQIIGDTGVTLDCTGAISTLSAQWQKIQLIKRDTNSWLLSGLTSVSILDSTITNADVANNAAIALSKLASGAAAQIVIANASGIPTYTTISGDVTIDSSGNIQVAADKIVNADVNASAAIEDTKLATIATALKVSNSATTAASANTASAIVARDASGNFVAGKATLATADVTTVLERALIVSSGAGGTINIDFNTNPTVYYTSNSSANCTLNIRGTSSVTLNNSLTTGQIATVTFLETCGAVPYYPAVYKIDGASVTPKWMGGTAPSSGNANSVGAYTFAIIKTGNAAFTVFASQSRFA